MNHRASNVLDELAELFDMAIGGRVSATTSLFIRAALNNELTYLAEQGKNDTELQDFLAKLKTIPPPSDEEPKKRGRKKKEPEVVVPDEDTPEYDTEEQAVADAAGVPVEEVVKAWEEGKSYEPEFEILPPDGEHGLDKRIGRLSTLNGLSTETCVKLGASPLLVANTVGKTGKHPFFKGAIAYISYLPRERQKHYMANALAYDGYKSFSDFCDIDEQRKGWEEMGIDMDFVSTILTDDETPNLRPASKVVNEDGVVEKIKLAGGFKKITEVLGSDGEELVKFMARYGINNQLLVDILTIVKKHNDDPNEALLPF